MSRTIPITLAAYNEAMVQAIRGPLRSFVHPGDEIDFVSGNRTNPLSIPNVNRWCEDLASTLPPGTLFAAHTSGLPNSAALVDQALPEVRSILLDYEPDFEPEFTWEFAPTLAHLDRFAAICRAKGRRAVAYPTGRPIQESPLVRFGWDYAELMSHVDDLYPQTQHWASLGAAAWASATAKLRAQRVGHQLDPRPIAVQLTIGQGGNAIPAGPALDRYQEVLRDGLRRLYVWWSPPVVQDLARFLAGIES